MSDRNNMGEAIVGRILEEYVQKSDTKDIRIFHNVLISMPKNDSPDKKINCQYDHIIVSQEGIIVIETKYWHGITYVIRNKDDIKLLEGLLHFPESMKHNNKKEHGDTLIFNVKSPNDKIQDEPYKINFYSPSSIIGKVRARSACLKEYLSLKSPILNMIVFVEKENQAKLVYVGEGYFDPITHIISSEKLNNELNYRYDENAFLHNTWYCHSRDEYHSACTMLAQYTRTT